MAAPKNLKLLLAGILPVLVFSVIEEFWGIIPGLIAGMIFGVGEIIWEFRTQGRVDAMTWGGNGMLLILGGVSLFTQEGVWFKLQPAFLEAGFSFFLWGSVFLKKPLILAMAQKQGALPRDLNRDLKPGAGEILEKGFYGMTWRMGLFFAIHAGLATWAALRWSTTAWALLKGVGLTVSLMVYMVVETLFLRYRLSSRISQ